MKGSFRNSKNGVILRKGLVVVQFIASVILIVGTITIYRQLDFMINKDIGVNVNQVLVVERPGISAREREVFNSAVDVFRSEINKHPDIEAISTSMTVPGKQREFQVGVKPYGAPDSDIAVLRINSMDYDFLDVFEMEMIAGRAFSKSYTTDEDTAIILTESSARLLGFDKPEDAVGKTVTIPSFEWSPIVVGVVNDYHQVSLKKAVSPTLFYCTPYRGEFYSLRINTQNLSDVIAHAGASWEAAFPGNPFDYFFLDEYFNRQYQNEKRFGNLSLVFALLAIFLGCMGLFGLAGYTTLRRTKEIGIRKVLGASPSGIVYLLSKDTLKLILVAIVISFPLAYWAMNQWLENFAYRIEMGWAIFALAGLVTLLIAFLTVGFQSLKAAMANPAESMRTE